VAVIEVVVMEAAIAVVVLSLNNCLTIIYNSQKVITAMIILMNSKIVIKIIMYYLRDRMRLI
jgi:hypothetical protein